PLSRNLSRKRALEMLLTGDFIDAATAEEWGLINRVADSDTLEAETRALAQKIATKTPLSIQLGKQMFYRQLELPLGEAYAFASERMACNMDSEDAREGIDAFLEKRPPRWQGR
ncbi:MAG: enoyl-CoA hydratase-related protein, partial [Myxococcota bacterium]